MEGWRRFSGSLPPWAPGEPSARTRRTREGLAWLRADGLGRKGAPWARGRAEGEPHSVRPRAVTSSWCWDHGEEFLARAVLAAGRGGQAKANVQALRGWVVVPSPPRRDPWAPGSCQGCSVTRGTDGTGSPHPISLLRIEWRKCTPTPVAPHSENLEKQ